MSFKIFSKNTREYSNSSTFPTNSEPMEIPPMIYRMILLLKLKQQFSSKYFSFFFKEFLVNNIGPFLCVTPVIPMPINYNNFPHPHLINKNSSHKSSFKYMYLLRPFRFLSVSITRWLLRIVQNNWTPERKNFYVDTISITYLFCFIWKVGQYHCGKELHWNRNIEH